MDKHRQEHRQIRRNNQLKVAGKMKAEVDKVDKKAQQILKRIRDGEKGDKT